MNPWDHQHFTITPSPNFLIHFCNLSFHLLRLSVTIDSLHFLEFNINGIVWHMLFFFAWLLTLSMIVLDSFLLLVKVILTHIYAKWLPLLHILFIWSHVNGNLACFHVCVMINKFCQHLFTNPYIVLCFYFFWINTAKWNGWFI